MKKIKRVMTRKKMEKIFGGIPAAAKFFEIAPAAVYMWPETKPIPEKRELQMRVLMPEVFM
jgi:hypothetical protein